MGPRGQGRHGGPQGTAPARAERRAATPRVRGSARPRTRAASKTPTHAQALYEKRKPAIGKLEADIAAKQLELVALGSAAPTQLVDVEVPAGAAPGSAVEAQASDGSVVKITVPEGAKPGDKLKVRVPKVMPATAVPAPAENVPTVTGTPAPPEKQASMVEEP